jgi:hypothetical protein
MMRWIYYVKFYFKITTYNYKNPNISPTKIKNHIQKIIIWQETKENVIITQLGYLNKIQP